jgi:serine/threonine protein phosphatase 1
MLEKLRRRISPAGAAMRRVPKAPPGSRIYAIGDIHGRRDLLEELHGSVRADARSAQASQKTVVYIGDYVDRGDDSRGVIEQLMTAPLDGFRNVHILGNHEDILLRFLEDATVAPLWLANGGDATLYSYGVDWRQYVQGNEFEPLRLAFRAAIPSAHLRFLRSLSLSHIEGDYLFVHAGIRPGREVDKQDAEDLMWIRDEFLGSDADHGKVVVHGHSISSEPQMLDNRIGIDTGAFATGKLTCLVLEGAERRFLQT